MKWRAQDKDQAIFTFSEKPYISHPDSIGFWWHPTASIKLIGKGKKSVDWKNSLTKLE